MSARGTVIVAGSLAQRPGYGGHAWVFLQYLLGFRRLGCDVLFLDRLDAAMCRDRAGQPCPAVDSWNLASLAETMSACGLGDAWSLRCGDTTFGVPREHVLEKARESVLLLNVMGFLDDAEILAATQRRAFLDIDPGFGQMWQALGLAEMFTGHDACVTIGENIGHPGCTVPVCGIGWITTPQPVVLDQWPVRNGAGCTAFTTVASWRGPFGPVEYEGRSYGLRVHEWRKFAALPVTSGQRFEVAMDLDAADAKDRALLEANGWQLIPPRTVAGGIADYRSFVSGSRAEVMIAKNMYVATRGGWFSDRSICYLAAGKPVLAQETGFSRNHPAGHGLLAFSTPEEAAEGVRAINADYAAHCRTAREIAEAQFDSDKVLTRLLGKLEVTP